MALKVLSATKVNSNYFVALRNFPEILPGDSPFSKKGRKRDSLRVLCATKSICLGWFELSRLR
jgi:hypothetical protein